MTMHIFVSCAAAGALTAAAIAATPPAHTNTSGSTLAPPPNGMVRTSPSAYLLAAGTIHTAPGETIDGGVVLVEDGFITSVMSNEMLALADVAWPAGMRRIDLGDAHLYAAFVEPYAEVEAPDPERTAPGAHWNEHVTPERTALDGGGIDGDAAERLRAMGFGAAAIAPEGGVFRGSSALVSLAHEDDDPSAAKPPVYAEGVYHSVGFDTVGWGSRPAAGQVWSYPNSHMGAIAVIRQSLSDADYLAATNDPGPNALLALNEPAPLLIESRRPLTILHAENFLSEFDRQAMFIGTGNEYWRLDAVADTGRPVLAPLNFPDTPDIDSPGEADAAALRDLMHWEQAPTNPWRLLRAGLPVAFTTHELRGKLFDRVRESLKTGLTEDEALAMFTTTPAALLGADEELGKIEAGFRANLLVSTGPVFREKVDLLEIWIDGRRHELKTVSPFDGTWDFTVGDWSMQLEIDGTTVTAREGEGDEVAENKPRKVEIAGDTIKMIIDDEDDGTGAYPVTGTLLADGTIAGHGMDMTGNVFEWTGTRTGAGEAAEYDAVEVAEVPELMGHPFGIQPYDRVPEQPERLVITNAALWTAGPDGNIAAGEIAIRDGIIEYVGRPRNMDHAGAVVIDAQGKHVTPGLIDTHSHTGTFGGGFSANEGGQAVTSEVRIADSVDPGHVNFYRKLAGGTTTSGMLHGSANTIGGQNAVLKNRWGSPGLYDHFFEGAMPGIKFALGENPRAVNFSAGYGRTYPQSRMGVEAQIRERFHAAQAYAAERDASAAEGRPFRRDLELEAIAEILAGERLVHCHSYRQDEVFMLCDVARDFGFTIGTFQHILEGYKVAERIRDHAIGASAFSDWWAFKMEVQDAIPWNGAIMHEVGVNVSFNSDDDSLSRRLNHEAAKAVRYGGLDPAEAIKFLTINPATQLAIAHRVGSLEPGKDADLVLWSGDPLSTLSRVESVWIDGRNYFNLELDAEVSAKSASERERLLRKILEKPKKKDSEDEAEDGGSEATEEAAPQRRRGLLARMHRNSREMHYMQLVEQGHDPLMIKCGACGCLFEAADFAFGH